MTTIRIKDFTGNNLAVSASDGEKVFEKIKNSFDQKSPVILDFQDIELTITAFLNSSIGKLYSIYSTEEIRSLLDIQNLNQEEIQLLKLVIDRAKLRFNKDYPTNLDNEDLLNED